MVGRFEALVAELRGGSPRKGVVAGQKRGKLLRGGSRMTLWVTAFVRGY
jgi:hypothetical protein